MLKIKKLIVTLAIVMVACCGILIYALNLKSENNTLKLENETLKQETNSDEVADLVPCYLCGGTVKILPVNESFYIECADCDLETTYFKSKSELIRYWNKETTN